MLIKQAYKNKKFDTFKLFFFKANNSAKNFNYTKLSYAICKLKTYNYQMMSPNHIN